MVLSTYSSEGDPSQRLLSSNRLCRTSQPYFHAGEFILGISLRISANLDLLNSRTIQKGGQTAVVLERAAHANVPTSLRSRDTASSSRLLVSSSPSIRRQSAQVYHHRLNSEMTVDPADSIADQDDHLLRNFSG
jgi:hypothetical protein